MPWRAHSVIASMSSSVSFAGQPLIRLYAGVPIVEGSPIRAIVMPAVERLQLTKVPTTMLARVTNDDRRPHDFARNDTIATRLSGGTLQRRRVGRMVQD